MFSIAFFCHSNLSNLSNPFIFLAAPSSALSRPLKSLTNNIFNSKQTAQKISTTNIQIENKNNGNDKNVDADREIRSAKLAANPNWEKESQVTNNKQSHSNMQMSDMPDWEIDDLVGIEADKKQSQLPTIGKQPQLPITQPQQISPQQSNQPKKETPKQPQTTQQPQTPKQPQTIKQPQTLKQPQESQQKYGNESEREVANQQKEAKKEDPKDKNRIAKVRKSAADQKRSNMARKLCERSDDELDSFDNPQIQQILARMNTSDVFSSHLRTNSEITPFSFETPSPDDIILEKREAGIKQKKGAAPIPVVCHILLPRNKKNRHACCAFREVSERVGGAQSAIEKFLILLT